MTVPIPQYCPNGITGAWHFNELDLCWCLAEPLPESATNLERAQRCVEIHDAHVASTKMLNGVPVDEKPHMPSWYPKTVAPTGWRTARTQLSVKLLSRYHSDPEWYAWIPDSINEHGVMATNDELGRLQGRTHDKHGRKLREHTQKNKPHIDSERILSETVNVLEGLVHSFELIGEDDINATILAQYTNPIRSSLRKLSSKLNTMTANQKKVKEKL
jgi:hypothetical protein